MKQLAIIIINYNSTDHLIKCLASIREEPGGEHFHIIVVDNASEDQSCLKNKVHSFAPDLLLNQKNRGFAIACNKAIRYCSEEFVLLLNPDVVIHKNGISNSLNYLKSKARTGIVGCRVLNPDGSLQVACRRSIPTVRNSFYYFLGLSKLFPTNQELSSYNLTYLDEKKTNEVEAVSGSFLMFRRKLVDEIGLIDEQFFLYGEDLDFCYRALLAGWQVEYYSGAEVTHWKGQSSAQNVSKNTEHFFGAMKLFYMKHYAPTGHPVKTRTVIAGINLLHAIKRILHYLKPSPKISSKHKMVW